MLLSKNEELRLHIPSNAVDDVTLLSGIIDNSEKDFLRDKLGTALYDRLCEYYESIDPLEFYNNVVNGSYTADPWAELLLNAQRMVCNDALARFAYQQVISVNGSGINVVSGNDYGNADDRLLDKGVGGYKKEAAIACNNLLTLLEEWAKAGTEAAPSVKEIVILWAKSRYYYLHCNLLIQSCAVLQHFVDIYESRERFIRLLPDLHFIQDEYISDAIGEDFVTYLLSAETIEDESERRRAMRVKGKIRRLMAVFLEQRTTVLSVDKQRRQQAHDESIALRANLLNYLRTNQTDFPKDIVEQCPFYDETLWQESAGNKEQSAADAATVSPRLQNNTAESKIFKTRLLY